MPLKSYKPTTPGQRGLVLIDRSTLWQGRPVKSLTEGLTQSGGRNNGGRITARRRGGGAKRLYRKIDFTRNKFDVGATVERIEYDPNRTAFIALLTYEDGEQRYILAPQRLAVGDRVIAANRCDVKPGNAMPFSNMPIGTIVHNIELKPKKGGQIARAAGAYAQFIGRDDAGYAQLRLSSGEVRMVRQECMATVGAVSNPDNSNQNLGKAGRKRHKGIRPSVRGVVMNPVDHPHGGGEGRTSGGRHPVSPWGVPTKGKKTRKRNNPSSRLIIRSRHARKKRR
ncbi:MAG: 50S ribosomal protein L2 [Aestuariivita sp.]|nr:50S ribosomal protein L2 [Aestuariivita sp.]MCY4203992.1 50S ribosomal protein L2 [Aestuariivita sp.]MCY4289697.1 50S ribosomal protein L2 [Aestuariivita sp.]MCY4348094.1 50S ribosomal protein L2 [Aestuariivita sp.]